MLPFVQYCNEQRRNAESDFESGLYKPASSQPAELGEDEID